MCIYKTLNGPAVEILKHMWYVELVIIVVLTVACDALPETYFQLLSTFCLI